MEGVLPGVQSRVQNCVAFYSLPLLFASRGLGLNADSVGSLKKQVQSAVQQGTLDR
jgi:hypothetical protein